MRCTTVLAWVLASAVALTGGPAAAQISHQGQDIGDHVVLRDGAMNGRGESDCPATASLHHVGPHHNSGSQHSVNCWETG